MFKDITLFKSGIERPLLKTKFMKPISQFLSSLLVCLFLVTQTSIAQVVSPAASDSGKVTVYTAKKIYTMNPTNPVAEAVAVQNGRVLSVGSLESMDPWLSKFDYTVDNSLEGKVIMPGFIDPHTHMYMSAGFMSLEYIGPITLPNPKGGDYDPVPDHDAVMAKLKQADSELKDRNEPLLAWGFDPAKQGGFLNREELDKISKDRPIYVIGIAPHFAFLNSAAIEKGELKGKDVHGFQYDENGELNGVFIEVLAIQTAMAPVFPTILNKGGQDGMRFMGSIANSAGVTLAADMMFGGINFDLEWKDTYAVVNEEDFPVRLIWTPFEGSMQEVYGKDVIKTYKKFLERNNDKIFVNGVKFFTDGSLPLMSSMVGYPGYLEGGNGEVNDIPWDQLADRMYPFWENDIQIHIHANGDLAVQAALNGLEELQNRKPRFDHRYTIEHYSITNQMLARRMGRLGAIASVNNYFSHFRALLHSDNAYGPDRANTFGSLASLEREGVIFALHSDYPQVVVPMKPLTAVWAAVNRIAEDGQTVTSPSEKIGVERAFRAITIDAAYILGVEDRFGSIEQGKFADFVVLEKDPIEIDPIKIKDIPVWGTLLNGKPFKNTR